MAAATITASAVRALNGDPDDTFEAYNATGYTPEKGDLVSRTSTADTVDGCDATDANSLTYPAGIVESYQLVPKPGGGTRYRITVRERGTIEGFTGLTPGAILYTSTTAEKFDTADATASGITAYPVAQAMSATKIRLSCPVLG